jgi:hypothetical protein
MPKKFTQIFIFLFFVNFAAQASQMPRYLGSEKNFAATFTTQMTFIAILDITPIKDLSSLKTAKQSAQFQWATLLCGYLSIWAIVFF